jgi:hypothetical protein
MVRLLNNITSCHVVDKGPKVAAALVTNNIQTIRWSTIAAFNVYIPLNSQMGKIPRGCRVSTHSRSSRTLRACDLSGLGATTHASPRRSTLPGEQRHGVFSLEGSIQRESEIHI